MLLRLYEMILEREIKKTPKHIVVICNELDKGFLKFVDWCRKFGIKEITVCSHEKIDADMLENFRVRIYHNDQVEERGEGRPIINILAGYTGHDEILNTLRRLAEMVLEGRLSPDDLDERTFESFLTVKSQPDIIIKAGNEVPEFLIWQGIYSELYFADIDWENLRYVDFLRILREYQRRERRYGR